MLLRRSRFGLSWPLAAFLASVGLVVVLVALLAVELAPVSVRAERPLLVHCAAGLKPPVEAAARAYERVYGLTVQLQYGGSQALLAGIQATRVGDLFVPGDDSYLDVAREKGLAEEVLPLAEMRPVLAVARGNPKGARRLDDLLRDDVRLAVPNPDAAAAGKSVRDLLGESGKWAALVKKATAVTATVNDVANSIKVGGVDAGFVWDATVAQYPELEAVPLAELGPGRAHISAAVLKDTTQPTAALRFARFLAARDRGLREFERFGYRPVEGDVWAERPELRLAAGAMLRPAIERTLVEFEDREGVRVTRVYNGCGILVGQMRTGERPDAYFSCDASFMKQVLDLFIDPVTVSSNRLVIVVPRGNPRGIRTLADLGAPNLRVGVGHEKQCAMGVLTEQTLEQGGVLYPVSRNVVVRTPTGDLLVNQLRSGALDAAIAYLSNAQSAGDELEAVPIDVPCAVATQPFAVGKASPHRYLGERLLAALRSEASRQRFLNAGFKWQLPPQEKP